MLLLLDFLKILLPIIVVSIGNTEPGPIRTYVKDQRFLAFGTNYIPRLLAFLRELKSECVDICDVYTFDHRTQKPIVRPPTLRPRLLLTPSQNNQTIGRSYILQVLYICVTTPSPGYIQITCQCVPALCSPHWGCQLIRATGYIAAAVTTIYNNCYVAIILSRFSAMFFHLRHILMGYGFSVSYQDNTSLSSGCCSSQNRKVKSLILDPAGCSWPLFPIKTYR